MPWHSFYSAPKFRQVHEQSYVFHPPAPTPRHSKRATPSISRNTYPGWFRPCAITDIAHINYKFDQGRSTSRRNVKKVNWNMFKEKAKQKVKIEHCASTNVDEYFRNVCEEIIYLRRRSHFENKSDYTEKEYLAVLEKHF